MRIVQRRLRLLLLHRSDDDADAGGGVSAFLVLRHRWMKKNLQSPTEA
jgi:hypothetical protein